MNILMVTLGFYPATAWGGPVKIVYLNARELVRRGHQVTVYCTNLLDKRNKIQNGTFERSIDGIRVIYFDTWNIPRWPGTLGPIWLPGLHRYVRGEIRQYDLVHLNGYRNFINLPVISAARAARVPVIMQPHGGMPRIVNSLFVKRLYDRFLGEKELEGLAALIALQESEVLQAVDHGVDPQIIEIIHNGVDLSEINQAEESISFRKKIGLAEGVPLVLFLGRINRKKGTDMLVEAFASLADLDVFLAIVGPDDGQLSEVKRLVDKFGLKDRVAFPGMLVGDDVLAAFRDADIFVLPCRTDTFPTTIIEACSTGTPMVITEGCEIAHLVKDRVAEVTPFDSQAFSDGMRSLLLDKGKYERYKANCPAVLEDSFSLDRAVDMLESLYQRVLSDKRGH